MSVQICETYRRADKIRQKIVRHVGIAMNEEELIKLKDLAEGIKRNLEETQKGLPLFSFDQIQQRSKKSDKEVNANLKDLREEQRVIDGIGNVFGKVYEQLGFDKIFESNKQGRSNNEVLKNCVLARLAEPRSKLRTAGLLEEDFGIKISVDRIYRMMDQLTNRLSVLDKIAAQATMSILNQKVDVMLYDVTTLHFESQNEDKLRRFGFSKACKFNETQIVLALAASKEGLPLAYQIFEGNKAETNTFIETLDRFSKQFEIDKVICVADRAMFSEKNLAWIESKGWGFVVAAKLKGLSKELKSEVLDSVDYKPLEIDGRLIWEKTVGMNDSRKLVVTYSKERAKKDKQNRDRLVQKITKSLNSKLEANTEKLIPNHGVRKFISSKETGRVALDQSKIKHDTQWDGLHGVITSKNISSKEALSLYASLWQIEANFRLSKHDLKMRPIYHFSSDRIKAHVAICFIAHCIAKHAQYRISLQYKPLSFAAIQQQLLNTQSSILRDLRTKKFYRMPSNVSSNTVKIYQVFGLKHSTKPTAIT